MNRSRLLLLSTCVVGLVGGIAAACGDDDALVRPRVDGGTGDVVVTDGDPNTETGPACTLQLPADYVSAAFETNAKLELDLRTAFSAFLAPMANNETAIQADAGAGTVITKAQLDTLWNGGNPSVKSITTPYWQTRIDGWLKDYEEATSAGPFTLPSSGDAPPPDGGTYQRYTYNPAMLDLKQAIEKGSYTAAFFNHAAGIVAAGNLSEASIDRLVAAWGAHASFQNNHIVDAGATAATRDVNSAGYAARRTPKDGTPGPYVRAKSALIKAKAAIAAGATCNADRDQAIKDFFLEWEKATYATVVFYFSDILGKVQPSAPIHADTVAWTNIFHSHGECIGFIAGFKQTPQAYRKITDAQIDGLLQKALNPEGTASSILQLKSAPATAAISLNGALADIKTIYGFTDEEMTSFKQVYSK
jgi:hypothetical protein